MNFSENLPCVIQDEVACNYYHRELVSIFTVVMYRRKDHQLLHRSYCVVCDDLTHDIMHVMSAMKEIRTAPDLLVESPDVFQGNSFRGARFIHYFTDGAKQHFKSRKAMWFLGQYKELFGVPAAWNFYASGHGKGPCDGIGSCLKSLVRRASLRNHNITDAVPMINARNICSRANAEFALKITVCHLEAALLVQAREVCRELGEVSKPITNISKHHHFIHTGNGIITIRKVSLSSQEHTATVVKDSTSTAKLIAAVLSHPIII
jgi:hypothetical protein